MATHPTWFIADGIRFATRLAPDLFKGHEDTPRKWLRPGASSSVRPSSLGPGHITELVDLAKRISAGVACGSSVFTFAFNQRLAALGCDYRLKPRDTRRFLHELDIKWRKPAGDKKKFTEDEVRCCAVSACGA